MNSGPFTKLAQAGHLLSGLPYVLTCCGKILVTATHFRQLPLCCPRVMSSLQHGFSLKPCALQEQAVLQRSVRIDLPSSPFPSSGASQAASLTRELVSLWGVFGLLWAFAHVRPHEII